MLMILASLQLQRDSHDVAGLGEGHRQREEAASHGVEHDGHHCQGRVIPNGGLLLVG